MYRLRTLNLSSPTGGKAYGIPRKFAAFRFHKVLLHLPRTRPHFVLTRGSLESMNESLARTSMHIRNTRMHMHCQILTSNRRRSADIAYRACITYVKRLKCDELKCTIVRCEQPRVTDTIRLILVEATNQHGTELSRAACLQVQSSSYNL